MAGDSANARLWMDADVYVSFDLDAVVPATVVTAFSAAWNLVGLLNGDDGFPEARSEDVSDHYAWGGILMRTSRKNFKLTKGFTAFEQNAVVNRLMWPGSVGATVKVPRVEPVKIAFETRDGSTIKRLISTGTAEIMVDGDRPENETDISWVKFQATIFPTNAGELFTVQPAMDYFLDA